MPLPTNRLLARFLGLTSTSNAVFNAYLKKRSFLVRFQKPLHGWSMGKRSGNDLFFESRINPQVNFKCVVDCLHPQPCYRSLLRGILSGFFNDRDDPLSFGFRNVRPYNRLEYNGRSTGYTVQTC